MLRSPHRARALAAALSTLLLASCDPGQPRARPSVVLVSIDTLRADHVGLYGYERDTTPFLDAWAEGGIVYDRAFSPCPWTLIAHMTMLTGLFPTQHGVLTSEQALAGEIPLLAERLQAAGYQTVGLYRESWIHPRYGFERGFEVFRAHEDAAQAGEHLSEELARLDRTRPYFLFLHLFDVHNGVSRASADAFYPSPPPYETQFLEAGSVPLPTSPPEELWDKDNPLTPEQVKTLVSLYDGGIRHVDAMLERWFGDMERAGWLDGALVIVTSDHGESLAQRGRLDGHGGFAQEGLHVPLIVRLPDGARAGTRVEEPVHLGDLVPTVLDVTGLPGDGTLPGLSLLGALDPRRVLAGAYPPNDYVLQWPEKLMRSQDGRCLGVDLQRDPGELQLRPGSKTRFEELLRQAVPPSQTFAPAREVGPMSEEERDALRAIGY